MSTATPLVTFGLCTDVQAAAKPDSTSKDDPTRILRYSEASSLLGAAVDYFNMFGAVSFVLHCGDIIDGRDDEESDLQDLESVLTHFRRLSCSGGACHVVGNHCLKNIPRSKLLACLGLERAYFARPLCTGWRLIVLDTTDLSVHGGWPQDSAEYAAANAYLSAHAGEARMVRWNGGVGAAQLAWLEGQLGEARTSGERVVVASHHCLAQGACRETHRAWNGDEVCAVLRRSGVVALCLAGHDHIGGFSQVEGIAHVTLEAILEAPVGSNAYGVCRLFADRIEIDGCGTCLSTRTLPLKNKIRRTRASYDEAELEVAAAVTQGEAASSQGSAPAAEPASPRRTRASYEAELEVASLTGVAATSTPSTPAAASASSGEIAWLLESECAFVLGRAREQLQRCARSLSEGAAATARSAQLRGGNADDGMLVAAVVGATALHAMRMQIEFAKWNESRPYVGMLNGGQKGSLSLPALLHLQNRVAQAIGACAAGGRTLQSAKVTVAQALALVSDGVRTLSLAPQPQAPSSLAPILTSMMQPPIPQGVIIDVNVASDPPRLVFSSYLLRASDGVVINARHVAVHPEELEERLAMLTETAREVRSLLAKLEAVEGLEVE